MRAINPYKIGDRILNKSNRLFYSYVYNLQFNDKDFPTNMIPVIKRAKGPYLYDFDQNRYIDFYMSGGNLLLGHVVPQYTKVIKSWFNRGYSTGYPFLQSNQMLINRLGKIIDIYKSNNYLAMFFNSPIESLMATLFILKGAGLSKGGFITGQSAELDFKIYGLEIADYKSDNPSKEMNDFLILKPTTPDVFNRISDFIDIGGNRGAVTVLDERDFPAVFYQYSLNKWIDADIRVLGNWISSGNDFGAILIKKNILSSLSDNYYNLLYYLENFKFPPLYKIKGAIRFLDILNKRGGIEAIADFQNFFIKRLKRSYLLMKSELIFINTEEITNYKEFWFKMLGYGYFMPYNIKQPVFVSLAHDKELIKRVTKDLNKLKF